MKATEALFGMQRFGIEPGLDRVRALLARLGDPQDAFDAVLIAGTNGKGSTAAHLAAMLAQGDRRVGRFTSPHLVQPGERIVIGGEEMTADDFEQQAERILQFVALKVGDIVPTEADDPSLHAQVFEQNPPPGTKAQGGTAVDVAVYRYVAPED